MHNEPEESLRSTAENGGTPEFRDGETYCYHNGKQFNWQDETCINGFVYVCTGNSFAGQWQLSSPKKNC